MNLGSITQILLVATAFTCLAEATRQGHQMARHWLRKGRCKAERARVLAEIADRRARHLRWKYPEPKLEELTVAELRETAR